MKERERKVIEDKKRSMSELSSMKNGVIMEESQFEQSPSVRDEKRISSLSVRKLS